ncbi:hypothetical protein TIFTF001_016547 [Ficus carica]|uniref:Uncharacterized protein n=1 Tax=Ficus carica TaxID=3494 RepID=A0AA88A0J8_FICCA|nr:hypothetical protein TIFTF001_016547 [Ficus carica]
MRSNLEEKLMKRMAVVHRKAEEWHEQRGSNTLVLAGFPNRPD